MKISRESPDAEVRYAVRGYGDEGVKINNKVYASSLVLTPNHLDDSWEPGAVRDWEPSTLDTLLEHDPEILLIGTGAQIHMLGAEFMAHALRQGVGLEVMDTEAACRTFNVLVSEGRRVVAGLVIE
ncbi:MAG: Mth938-like domain-containing protein [Gammaproteobacteria bacterium]|nr:Mth938-like domain-containing protein [Gammaproteobacteria bacterium]